MTQRFSKIIKRSITNEDEVIGNLKRQFFRNTLHGQRLIGISPAIANGNIALAYYRGLSEGREESKEDIQYWKNKYLKLKNKKASET